MCAYSLHIRVNKHFRRSLGPGSWGASGSALVEDQFLHVTIEFIMRVTVLRCFSASVVAVVAGLFVFRLENQNSDLTREVASLQSKLDDILLASQPRVKAEFGNHTGKVDNLHLNNVTLFNDFKIMESKQNETESRLKKTEMRLGQCFNQTEQLKTEISRTRQKFLSIGELAGVTTPYSVRPGTLGTF